MENHKSNYPGSVTYHFFYSGPFSNWYKSNFEYKNVIFNCAEQAMMFHKALLFGDDESARKILLEPDPRKQKEFGRWVRGFNQEVWDDKKYELVKDILYHKFVSSEHLRLELLKYKSCFFVEASPSDRIWGIGYDKEHAIENMSNWGQNLLGRILTELSNEL